MVIFVVVMMGDGLSKCWSGRQTRVAEAKALPEAGGQMMLTNSGRLHLHSRTKQIYRTGLD